METSRILAQIIGPTLFIMGVGLALNAEKMREIGERFLENPVLIYVSGFIALTYGLVIVTLNSGQPDSAVNSGWPGMLTAIGWLFILGGIIRLLAPGVVTALGRKMLGARAKPALMTAGAILMAVGGWLAIMGYGFAG